MISKTLFQTSNTAQHKRGLEVCSPIQRAGQSVQRAESLLASNMPEVHSKLKSQLDLGE